MVQIDNDKRNSAKEAKYITHVAHKNCVQVFFFDKVFRIADFAEQTEKLRSDKSIN